MKISIPGLGGRLRRARQDAGLSQVLAGERIGVSWMMVHRWERSERSISEENLSLVCQLYDRPLLWFLTLEEGDLDRATSPGTGRASSAERLSNTIAEAPAALRPLLEKIAEDILDGLRRLG